MEEATMSVENLLNLQENSLNLQIALFFHYQHNFTANNLAIKRSRKKKYQNELQICRMNMIIQISNSR